MISRRSIIKALKILFVVSIILSFGLFINATDIHQVAASLYLVGTNFIFLIAITFIAYLCGTIACWFCLGKNRSQLSVGHLFVIRHMSETVSLLNPASVVGGEALKVVLLTNEGIERKVAITSVVISRAVMVLTQVFLFVLAAGMMMADFKEIKIAFLDVSTMLTVAAFSFVPLALFVKSDWFKKQLSKTRWSKFATSSIQTLKTKLRALKQEVYCFLKTNKSCLVWSVLFFLLHWIIGSLELFLILKFLGVNISIPDALFLDMGVVFFKTAGAFVPAQIGFEEYGNKIMLSLIGIAGDEIWLTVSVLRRLRQLFWILLGILFYSLVHKKYRNIFAGS